MTPRTRTELAAHHHLGEEFLAQVRSLSAESETVGTRAIRDRRSSALRQADTAAAAGLMSEVYAAEGIRTACLVPLIGGEEALGLLGLYHRADRPWPADEVALLEAFADQAAVAIQNARLYRSVADQAARMKSIQDLSARLNRLTDVRAIAEAIVAEATTLAEYHDIRVYQVDWERRSATRSPSRARCSTAIPRTRRTCCGSPWARASPGGWPSMASRC